MNLIPNNKIVDRELTEEERIDKLLLALVKDSTPADDIRRVIKKLLERYMHLGDLATSFGDLANVVPSTLGYVQCMKIYREHQRQSIIEDHPRTRTEAIMEFNNQLLSDDQVIVFEGEAKKKNINMGMIVDATMDMPLACAATLLNVYTQEKDGSIIQILDDPQKNKLCKIPDVSLVSVRELVITKIPSIPQSLNFHFGYFKRNVQFALLVMNKMYAQFPDYSSKNDKFADVCNQYIKKKGKAFESFHSEGFSPCTKKFKATISDGVTINQHWILISMCQGYLGGDKKRGGLLSGYYNFDTTPSFRKGWDRAREIMSIAKSMKFDVVKVMDTKIPALSVRILIANNFRVITGSGIGRCEANSPPGVYGYTTLATMTVLENKISQPTVKKAGVTYSNDFSSEFNSIFCPNKPKGIQLVYTFLVPGVIEKLRDHPNIYALFPSLSGHSGKVWMVKYVKTPSHVPTVEEMIKRNLEMCFTRNVFALTRKPYYPDDSFGSWFVRDVFVPKIVRNEKEMGKDYFKVVDFRNESIEPIKNVDPNDYVRVESKPMIVSPESQLRFSILSRLGSMAVEDFGPMLLMLYKARGTDGQWEILLDLVKHNELSDDMCRAVKVFLNGLQTVGDLKPVTSLTVGTTVNDDSSDSDEVDDNDAEALNKLSSIDFSDMGKKI